MGRITLAVLILAIAAGVYWFWWSDQGANGPITLKGTISYAGMPGMDGTLKSNFTLQAVPNKIRSTADIQGQRISSIIDLKKKKMYVLNDAEKTYAVEEFDLVGMSQTEKQDKWENTWFSVLKQTADWDYIGNGEGKHFCNKQTLEGLPTELTGATKTATGASAAAAALAQEVSKNVKGEAWFTPGTRLGWRYFSTLNKLMRVRPNGTGQRDTAKRPQFKYVNLDFFPIPMKATVSLGPMRMQMEVDKLSRGKISKDVFEVPQDYRLDNSASAKGNTSVLPFSSVQNQQPPAPRATPAPSRTVRTPPRTPTRRVVIPRRTRTTST
jgi:hypothetical protein